MTSGHISTERLRYRWKRFRAYGVGRSARILGHRVADRFERVRTGGTPALTAAELIEALLPAMATPVARRDYFGGPIPAAFGFERSDASRFAARAQLIDPEGCKNLLGAAEALRQGRLNVFEVETRWTGAPDWHRDPISGERWPLHFWRSVNLSGESVPGDVKYVWEVNKHHWFVTLAQAFYLSGDERFAHTLIRQLIHWLGANPRGQGVNWNQLLVAQRLVSWLIAFRFMRRSPAFQADALDPFLSACAFQIGFTERHLLPNLQLRNNYIVAQGAALALAGGLLPGFRRQSEWWDRGVALLSDAVPEQTFPDGVHREQATSYLRLVAEALLLVVLVGRQCGRAVPDVLRQRLEAMLDYLCHLTDPSGRVPILGDHGEERLVRWQPVDHPCDHRDLLAAGAVAFGRPDWKAVAGAPTLTLLWWAGEDGLDAYAALPAELPAAKSRAFADGGHVVVRDRWPVASTYVHMRGGEFGLGDPEPCAHSHSDLLSVDFWAGGQPVLVDAGVFRYFGRAPDRAYFRSARAHNGVRIDGMEQAEALDTFIWTAIPRGCIAAEIGAEPVVIAGQHDGYCRLREPVVHRREVQIASASRQLTLVDTFDGKGAHEFEWFFNLHPQCLVEQQGSRIVVTSGDVTLQLSWQTDLPLLLTIGTGWVATRYGHRQRNARILATARATLQPSAVVRWSWQWTSAALLTR